MSNAVINLTVTSRRMLNRREAAAHCGRSLRRFELECPVSPVRFPNGDLLFDVQDLDQWLDRLKGATEDLAVIVERLGS